MKRDDIIRMAREAGLHLYVNDLTEEPYALIVERFAALVAAAEREACAQVCDEIANKPSNVVLSVAINCADAIRARGEK
jgi:hypothetical protein